MVDPYIIVNLSDVLGYFLEDIAGYVGNIFTGWMFMLMMLSLGFMTIIYFRFFKTIPKVLLE